MVFVSSLCVTFTEILSYVFYIAIALAVLMIMITIHEFGHFIAGKKLGFKVNEFSIGFGKKIYQRTTKSGMLFSIRIIPLGGYCAFDGEDENSASETAFNNQKPWKRLIVLFAGAFANFLSAVIFSFILLITVGYSDVVQVKSISEYATNVTYSEERLMEDDVIYEVDGVATDFVNDRYFFNLIKQYEVGDEFELTVKRNGEIETVTLQYGRHIVYDSVSETFNIDGLNYSLTQNDDNSYLFTDIINAENTITTTIPSDDIADTEVYFSVDGMSFVYDFETNTVDCLSIGLGLSNYVYNFGEALVGCVPFTVEWGWKVLVLLWQLISGQLALSSVGGPVATIGAIATYTQNSWLNLLLLFPLISVNLAVFNLIPFPALDGARMVFVTIEWIRRKPINRNVEAWIHYIGLLVLFAFVIFVDLFNLLF